MVLMALAYGVVDVMSENAAAGIASIAAKLILSIPRMEIDVYSFIIKKEKVRCSIERKYLRKSFNNTKKNIFCYNRNNGIFRESL